MFQKSDKFPNIDNEVKLYVSEGKDKLNKDLRDRQYFMNFIPPDFNVMKEFSVDSHTDSRFQNSIEDLWEKEKELRQGTFNPLMYRHHIENDDPQNSLDYLNPGREPYDPSKEMKQYSSQLDNPDTSPYLINSNILYTPAKSVREEQHKNNFTPIITYNNSLFTFEEKQTISKNQLNQQHIDPMNLLNKQPYTIGSLLIKYKELYGLYPPQNPIKKNIAKAIQTLLFIIQKK